jgi:hypothetical protein
MTIDPHGEAFLNERLATAYMLPVSDLAVGRRFAPKTDFMYIAPSPRHAGGWPGPVWRVGSLEGVRTQYRWLVTADALVPIERLEPWESFGPNGRRVVDIIERLYRFDPNDLIRVRRRLGDGRRRPIARARIQVPAAMQAGSPEAAIRGLVLWAAERLDPEAMVDESWENGYQGDPRRLGSPMWEGLLTIANDAATGLFVDAAPKKTAQLEGRFWRLLEATAARKSS